MLTNPFLFSVLYMKLQNCNANFSLDDVGKSKKKKGKIKNEFIG